MDFHKTPKKILKKKKNPKMKHATLLKKMKFSIKDLLSKCDQIRRKLLYKQLWGI